MRYRLSAWAFCLLSLCLVIQVRAQEDPPPSEASAVAANQVTIDFNNLPPGVVVTDQYRPYLTFSANGFSAGGGYSTDVMSSWDGAYPGTIFSNWHVNGGAGTDVFMDFLLPVNNLRFKVLGSINPTYPACKVDVYVNYNYYNTYNVYGSGNPYYGAVPVNFDLGSLSNITGIHIHSVHNTYCDNIRCYWGVIYYDDLAFTPDLNINITNPRVSGNLQGQTKKALIGADVTLNAAANRAGGTYSWNVAGSDLVKQVVSTSADGKTLVVRWTEAGTYRVTSSYRLNGITTSSYIDVNVIMPTLASFVGTQVPDRVKTGNQCYTGLLYTVYPYHTLGCLRTDVTNDPGITFRAKVVIPNETYLSNPAQSGVKFIQKVSAYRAMYSLGSISCVTARNHDSDTTRRNDADETTGWQLDGGDPYQGMSQRFTASNELSIVADDSPNMYLGELYAENDPYVKYGAADAQYSDDQFETYAVYFTGSDPTRPIFQRNLALASAGGGQNVRVAYVPWKWNGGVLFGTHSQFSASCPSDNYQFGYCLNSYNFVGNIDARSKAEMRPHSGSVQELRSGQCPSVAFRAQRMIDVPRFFVQQQYKDFLRRNPIPGDEGGLDFWRGEITRCGFDMSCVQGMRVNVAKAFFYADEFISTVPGLNAAYRGTDSYNREFIRQCYYKYLLRTQDPEVHDPSGFNHWLDKLNTQYPAIGDAAYNEMIRAFIESDEYRNRPDFLPLPTQ
jgi:hypothetical protein